MSASSVIVVLVIALAALVVILWITAARSRVPGPRRQLASPPKHEEPLDVSLPNLRAVFGDDNVRTAWNLAIEPAATLIGLENKFGGEPSFVAAEQWPRCRNCRLAMTFIGQVRVGPERPIKHPSDGWLFVFLCNSDRTDGTQCETWTHTSGCSRCFVQPNDLPAEPLGASEAEHSALAAAVSRNRGESLGSLRKTFYEGIERPDGARPYLGRQYAAVSEVELPTVQLPDDPSELQYALAAAVQGAFAVQTGGGFPDWVQSPESVTCVCGSDTEFVMQLGAFDEIINLGDAGEAYVFACAKRCAPTSYYLFWQCC